MNVKLVSLTKSLVEEKELSAEELIVYVARVSNPSNQLNSETSDKLISYMVKNKHWSPFEMCDMTVEITTSRGIAQQVLRHRSFSFQEFCLSGDSLITLKHPNGNTFKRTLEHLYKLKFKPNQHIKRNGLPIARVFDGDKFIEARILDVFKTGVKPVFKITTADGKSVTATKEHKFLTREGFQPLEDIVGLKLTKSLKASMTKVGVVAVNGVALHQSKDWMSAQKEVSILNKSGVTGIADNANVSYHTIRKWLKIHKLQFTKKEVAKIYGVWNKGKFGYNTQPHSLATIEKMRTSAKKGKDSNLYKGGVDRDERTKIGDWAGTIRAEKLIEYQYKCNVCDSKMYLELDHIKPVYSHPELARVKENIQVLCRKCHAEKHNMAGDPLIWREKSKGNSLTVKWATIINIEYMGEVETYDLEVDHSTHNYVANGVVVHNSQRYAEVTDFEPVQIRKSGATNRQSSLEVFDPNVYGSVKASDLIQDHLQASESLYKNLLEAGVAKECARFVLPLTVQTKIYMKGSLRSWIHYLQTRTDEHTQLEHRQVAMAILEIFKSNFPNISKALEL